MMFLDDSRRKVRERTVVRRIQIVFIQRISVDDHLSGTYLDRFARQSDHAFDETLVRVVRIPKNHDVSAFDMAPTVTLDLVVNELIDEQSLAVVQFGEHRSALNDHRLDKKYSK